MPDWRCQKMPCEKFVCIAIYQEFSENMYKKKCHDINSLVKNLYTVKASGSGESFEQTTITTERQPFNLHLDL